MISTSRSWQVREVQDVIVNIPVLKRFPTRCPRNLRESYIRIRAPQVIHEFSWWTCQRNTSIYKAPWRSSKLIQCAAEFHQKKKCCVDQAIASTAHLTSLDAWGVGRKYLHSVPKTCTQSPQFPLNFRLDGRLPGTGKVAIIYNKHTENHRNHLIFCDAKDGNRCLTWFDSWFNRFVSTNGSNYNSCLMYYYEM